MACMINNLGGTSVLELNIVAREAVLLLGKLRTNIGINKEITI